MRLSDDEVAGLNIALEEAVWCGLSVDLDDASALATLMVLSLPETGDPPEDRRVGLLMQPLGRIAALRCLGRLDDAAGPVVPLTLPELEQYAAGGSMSQYGEDFFNQEERDPVASWRQPLSLDITLDPHACSISLDLRWDDLAVRLWFDEFRIFTPHREEIELSTFIEGGKRWWNGFNAGDPRTKGFGIY